MPSLRGRISHFFLMCTLVTLGGFWLLGAAGPDSPSMACPADLAQWERWVGATATDLVQQAESSYNRSKPNFERLADSYATTFDRCPLPQDNGFKLRVSHLKNFLDVNRISANPGHQLGFTVTDEQYFRETEQVTEIPSYLRDQEFLKAVQHIETLPQAKAYLEQLNSRFSDAQKLVFFSYRSRHLGTPDSPETKGRLLIVVPGNPEKWVQFGVPDAMRPPVKNVSVVSVLKDVENPKDGPRKIYFRDNYRILNSDGTIGIQNRRDVTGSTENCLKCHSSGVLPIFPAEGSVPAEELPRVETVNARFRSYGPPNYGDYLDLTKFGPGLGEAVEAPGLEALIKADFHGKAGVLKAMNCASCHDADTFGTLHFPFNKTILSSFIMSEKMPPRAKLTSDERTELMQLLLAEYFGAADDHPGILKSWLLNLPIDPNKNPKDLTLREFLIQKGGDPLFP